MQQILSKIRYFERYFESIEKLNFFFQTQKGSGKVAFQVTKQFPKKSFTGDT